MDCTLCGSKLAANATECGDCGQTVNSAPVAAAAASAPAPAVSALQVNSNCPDGCGGKLQQQSGAKLACDTCGITADSFVQAAPVAVVEEDEAEASSHTSVSKRLKSMHISVSTRTAFELNGGGKGTKRGARQNSNSVTMGVLGANIVRVDTQPSVDPLRGLKTKDDVSIPPEKRICSNELCLGDPETALDPERPDADPATGERYHVPAKLTDDHTWCDWCGREYWFVPELNVGDLVDRQYEIKGYIARGGFGLIYLAWDVKVGRYVVLKGVANANDPVAVQSAVEEKRQLADLDNPNIVKIFNFVEHNGIAYIVMQYVGGKTLKQLIKKLNMELLEKNPNATKQLRLPITVALAYIHGVLKAFEYLHGKGLVYRDFKLDNLMVIENDVILIDLGAVIQKDEQGGNIIFTEGYNPPETVPVDLETGTNCFGEFSRFEEVSDFYTIFRTIAAATVDFKFTKAPFLFDLPTPDKEPLFRKYPSFYRLLLKGTRHEPELRFQSIKEISEAIIGVMREIVCVESDPSAPRHMASPYFGADTTNGADAYTYRNLPELTPYGTDKAASFVATLLGSAAERRLELLEQARGQYPDSAEIPLRTARALVDLGKIDRASEVLNEASARDPFDWRATWVRMLLNMSREDYKQAREDAQALYNELPGELAPKLALAFAAEKLADFETAKGLYHLVSVCDNQVPSAALGLARVAAATRDREAAVDGYRRVPVSSIAYTNAQLAMVRTLAQLEPGEQELILAGQVLESLPLEGYQFHRVRSELLFAAAQRIEQSFVGENAAVTLLGTKLTATELRLAAAAELKNAAGAIRSVDPELAEQTVTEANTVVRPWTTF